MSVRPVLSVVLALALLAVTAPALDDAREHRSDQQVSTDLVRLERAADGLAASEDRTVGAGARRVVTVRLPGDAWTTREVAWVAVGGVPGDPDSRLLSYRLAGGPVQQVRTGVALHTADDTPLVLDGSGSYRLVLTLAADGVHVARS
ncbi:DUF7311 family protein [Haloarchaeobius sp. TZWSO28]|uniref:DUF7311 family protein n=1 Tax=Haloarchaeobius sp. TZWSO28 TaxID=3446119 RepID=UPI003EB8DD01